MSRISHCAKKKALTLTWTFLPNFPYLVLHLQVSPAAVRTASSPCAPPTGGPIPAPAWPAAWASRTTSLSSACVASATRAPANPARGTKGRTRWSHAVQEKLCGLRPFPCLLSPDALWSEWQPGCCCRCRWFWRCEGPEQWGTVVVGFFLPRIICNFAQLFVGFCLLTARRRSERSFHRT